MQFLYNINSIALIIVLVFFFWTQSRYSSFSIHQLHKVSFIHCFCFSFFFRQNVNIQVFLCTSYIKFLLFIFFFSDKISIRFSMHQLHKASFIHRFFKTKFQYSFLCISYIKLLLSIRYVFVLSDKISKFIHL